MDKQLKSELLDLLQQKDLSAVTVQLLEFLPEQHPAWGRTQQLEKRLRELEERSAMGTLSPEDIDRVQARISGGLREIVLDYKPYTAPAPAPPKPSEKSFSLNLDPEPRAEAPEAAPELLGFQGEVAYSGSPSSKEEVIVLQKSYGASYHIAVQAIRKCGMDMVSGDRAGGKIHATAKGNSMARFGENIYLWVTTLERARTRIHVVVDSANVETVFDFGRHQQKLSALLHQIRNA